MEKEQMCEMIFQKIMETVKEGKSISFEPDEMGMAHATLRINNKHTHIGWENCSFDQLVKNCYDALYDTGECLSFCEE